MQITVTVDVDATPQDGATATEAMAMVEEIEQLRRELANTQNEALTWCAEKVMAEQRITELEAIGARESERILDLTRQLTILRSEYGIVKDKLARAENETKWSREDWQRRREREAKLGPRYLLREIPAAEWPEVRKVLGKYLNTRRYQVRARGQHLRPEIQGYERRRRQEYGSYAIHESTHVRVYIDEKAV